MAYVRQVSPGHAELGRALVTGGVLSADWAGAFADVPRAAFLPELMWPWDMAAGRSVPVSRTGDPERWRAYADSDCPVVTQWDDGQHTGAEPGAVPTSSASMPSVVFRMLRDLDVRAGDRVLEIGTATGWNAALLDHRAGAGDGRVITMEVDEGVAERARASLEGFGSSARVVRGDGFEGWPEGAPYDRIIGTCGLRRFPWAWVEQCRPGGIIVAPWGTYFGNGDAVARLVVAADGRSASGRFTDPVEFMKLRGQRLPGVVHGEYVRGSVAEGWESSTGITEAEFLGEGFAPQRFVVGLRVRDCLQVGAEKRDGARPVWFYGLRDRSWACVLFRDGADARVWQYGPRRLWDEVEAAYRWWVARDRPGHERFGLTVTAEGERVWLDGAGESWGL
ncbi:MULTISPECIES: methyltransferase domain-containing protein [Streptomyces]|uniref:Protein-L-isoaspartate O-methyltransferase n=2 Tax=Streptomyces rimosus subsp. rimosus TaxID=132474 RepID=L8EYR7_STRR1|nr:MULTISPECIES: protein-L-isoaspartate O-methyltransferase [Streptomyces]KOG72974.1 protein-L-isoaspartate(D-aspartate) O-methyltransferase [Kitasatospora aureofaciens]MYT41633.1 protein-L-isoaspartate(D-aspartate) O-methyltransferase [Streptomyces sp. SID5471]KEF04463.1 protein-L-isoaspartate(D-aspartate) O-methyltransferase [Streptomyces rimosus]KEF20050.1 protein-L-isoaspartate(D-aspartate) O-methyltransferase [Streptomyces rimosus]KOT31169.1 protein-L-isoaspartate(D-aspartate) O-methyltra